MNTQVNTRGVILDILLEINEKNEFSNKVLNSALAKYQFLPHEDRSFISRVVMGTVERKITLDYIADQFSKVKTTKMKPIVRNIIRMSIYQIIFMDGVKDFAICNEAVKLAAKRGFVNLKGYVNGVLRNVARSKSDILNQEWPLWVKYSTPEWIVDKWIDMYGIESCEAILGAQFEDKSLSIRCNTTKTTVDKLEASLTEHGVRVEKSSIIPEALYISGYDYLDKLQEFNDGLFSVQDTSSMLVAHIANPQKSDNVLDVCAAPGGKSLHIAQLLEGTGKVTSRDVSSMKTDLIDENILRLGLSNVSTQVWDATQFNPDDEEAYDIVIADLPCSGLGILAKKPDIKYQASEDKCQELVKLQRSILTIVSKYVKKGGSLVFSTCTINNEENIENVKWFLENTDFESCDISEYISDKIVKSTCKNGYIEILPGNECEGMDGFFISKFVRK